MRNKVTTTADAVSLIQDGDTVCSSGFVGVGVPNELLLALEKRFLETRGPRNLTWLHAAGVGDGKDRGLNVLAHEGLLKRIVGGHFGLAPKIVQMINEEKFEAYNLPLGVITHLYRDIAASKPGTISRVGIGTFVDPRIDGGKLNRRTTEDLVRLMEIDGKEWLFYRAMPLQVALLRGTSADPEGNVSAEHESLDLDNLAMAMAVKNSGGGLDLAFLGLAKADREGNVNVSRFGAKIAGTGGFINISQNARKVVYAGTFAAGALDIETGKGQLQIVKDGPTCKFREQVSQITFSGRVAAAAEQPVVYVTERCVFQLTKEGLELIEVAPGVDIERDILTRMPFRPIVGEVGEMDSRIFLDQPIGLREALLELPLQQRIGYDSTRNTLFLNFEGLRLRSTKEVDALRDAVVAQCRSIGRRVPAVVSYDAFELEPDLEPYYVGVVAQLERDQYSVVSRYTTSAFMCLKLAQVLTRAVQPHIFGNSREAQAFHETLERREGGS